MLGPGRRCMILARLAAGCVEERAEDDGRQPPRGKIVSPSPGFHSVRGGVGGPGSAYVLHASRMGHAYPAYLVTYGRKPDVPAANLALW